MSNYLSLEETKRKYPRIAEVFAAIEKISRELDYLSGTLLGVEEAQARTEHPFMEYQSAERKLNREAENDRVFPLETVAIQEFRINHGIDLENAIIHTGPYADELARSLNALAVTIGTEIYFRDKAYNPGSEEGRQTIAHELTHISQYERSEEYRNGTREGLEEEAEQEERREQYNPDPIVTITINRRRHSFPKSRMKHYAEMAADKVKDWMYKQKYALNGKEYLDLLCAYDKWLREI